MEKNKEFVLTNGPCRLQCLQTVGTQCGCRLMDEIDRSCFMETGTLFKKPINYLFIFFFQQSCLDTQLNWTNVLRLNLGQWDFAYVRNICLTIHVFSFSHFHIVGNRILCSYQSRLTLVEWCLQIYSINIKRVR